MKLRRLEIQGGFLNGLDLAFSDGLNVLIGPRGSGKTSVIELIRFGLGVEAVTPEAESEAADHAYQVLEEGEVVITAEVAGTEVTIRRGAQDDEPKVEPGVELTLPLLISQNEIEAIGLDALSRRRILDGLAGADETLDLREAEARAEVERVSRAHHEVAVEREDALNRLEQLASAPHELRSAEEEQQTTGAEAAELKDLQKELKVLSDDLGRGRDREARLERPISALQNWTDELRVAREALPAVSDLPVQDPAAVQTRLKTAADHLGAAEQEASAAIQSISAEKTSLSAELLEKQRRLREISDRNEELSEGAGELAQRIASLRQQIQERDALGARADRLGETAAELLKEREAALDRLDAARDARYTQRTTAASAVNDRFEGQIEVRVSKASVLSQYVAALGTALQNSGLQYKSLSSDLAPRMSPRELVEAAERDDTSHIADAGAITRDRSSRLAAHLRSHGSASILAAPIEDVVDFALLDGQDYKTTANLSMGQRCTVVLPLLLAQQQQLTVLDQPEDHLDNAFIVDTVVAALQERPTDGQFLIATHNANIPVLAEADQVVVMASTGRRGYVDHAAKLDDQPVVSAITSFMEGGEQAFHDRARFYETHHE